VSTEPNDERKGEPSEIKWGVPLMKGIKATSLSILAEPYSKNIATRQSRRAVIFVSSTDTDASEMQYSAFQLQLSMKDTIKSEKKSFSILTKNVISGIIKDGTRSIGPISSIYLAGASFRFDLENPGKQRRPLSEFWQLSFVFKRSTNTLLVLLKDAPSESFVVTLGVARTPGGLEVISLDSANNAWTAPVINAAEVSKVWLVDIVHGGTRRVDTFVWAVELLNGELFCWSVPSLLGSADGETDDFRLSWFVKEAEIARPKGLRPPTLVCKRETRNDKRRFLLGILSHVGTSSDWMQQSSSGCQADIAMGPVPRSSYGCGLRAGQGSKTIHRMAISEFSGEEFSTNVLVSEVYGPSDFLMTPPAFVPSLYSMFLEAAYVRTEVAVIEESKAEGSSEVLDEENTRISVSPIM
jgi:hypothetical protein